MSTNSSAFTVDAIVSRLKSTAQFDAEADATLLITADTINEGFTLDVAGGLMLEHPMTLPFVEAVVGTIDTVMGLPKALTEKCILEAL
ncbi:hypothetical protein CIPAW_01G038800 [Carya illinoinensis]|uniref:Uncharacterized protein n=1 Tax=Carya illinoinensis TaxID=32201 RepID=A0A8T1RKE4_CARIL|nr:hypothetical protein CIPAW_01G038800 [Carya illinoinensis]